MPTDRQAKPAMSEYAFVWLDDYGKDHECFNDDGHSGGHECGCGARIPRHSLDVAIRLARAVAFVAGLDRPLKQGDGIDEPAALRTLAADAYRAGLLVRSVHDEDGAGDD